MKKLTICLATLLISFCGNTQVRVGIAGGYHGNFASRDFYTTTNPVINATRTSLRGGHIGFVADVPVSKKNWFFQPGIIYFKRGQNQDLSLDTSQASIHSISARQEQNYIDLPFTIAFKSRISKNFRFIVGGGLQFSLFISGKEVSTDFKRVTEQKSNGEDTTYVRIKEIRNENLLVGKDLNKYKLSFFSVTSFAGFELKNAYLTANYSKGLTNYYDRPDEQFKHDSWSATLGLYLFRSKSETAPKKEIDSDNDGVSDLKDDCPTLSGPSITNGCPDKDGDGIADSKDNCPDVAGILKYNGCPIPDTDNDGINDEEDKCPQIAGAKENSGCPIIVKETEPEEKKPDVKEEVVVDQKVVDQINMNAKRITFKFREAELTKESFKVLDEIVALLKDTDVKIKVEGHSSLEGNPKTNLKLSEERAESVKNYLISKGIAAERISSIGFGSKRPLVKGTSEKANIQNRRVEINIDK